MRSKLAWFTELEAELRAAYKAANRKYHNWLHITSLLADFHRLKDHWRHPEAVKTAILWHDFVYVALSPSNEADSAEQMLERLKELAEPSVLADAHALIITTASHTVPNDMTAELALDCALFLDMDMDMAILGADRAAFDQYDSAIREEFAIVPDEVYRPRRAEVLAGFLARDDLYLTETFKRGHDKQARANLQRAISRLS
jgi:predicted metal-dependent HD superfamily phosphohydrolase